MGKTKLLIFFLICVKQLKMTTILKRMEYDLIDDITKRNRSVIRHTFRICDNGNEANMGLILISKEGACRKESSNFSRDQTNNWPICLIEPDRETIQASMTYNYKYLLFP